MGNEQIFSDHPTTRLAKEDAHQWHFRDFPTKGNTLVVEYCPLNYPEIGVWIESNTKAGKTKSKAIRQLNYSEL